MRRMVAVLAPAPGRSCPVDLLLAASAAVYDEDGVGDPAER